jgi:2-oxoglutarate dehydrogenase E1 component
MLRRQSIRPVRKPLIVMSPKSLLRHKQAISDLDELAAGKFYNVIDEVDDILPQRVRRLVLCSGKVYYDLRDARRHEGLEDVAIIRLEQMYPFPEVDLWEVLAPYTELTDVVWCQEEPQNQGCWYSSQHHIKRIVYQHNPKLYLEYAGRKSSASPAAGYMALHIEQQKQLINDALGIK